MTIDEIKGIHFYGIVPNGERMDGKKAYMINWFTKTKDGIYRVPAASDRKNGIYPGCDETMESALRKAKGLSEGGKYAVVIFNRGEDYNITPAKIA